MGNIDPEASPHKFLINLKIHDIFMFLWEVVLELIMFIYILRKAKGKMEGEEYSRMISFYVQEVTTRNIMIITLFYGFLGQSLILEKYLQINIATHITCL
jgi:hypothetical protein